MYFNSFLYFYFRNTRKKLQAFRTSKKQKEFWDRIAKEKKFGKMMLIIMALFFVTYFPTYLLKKVDFNTYEYISDTV